MRSVNWLRDLIVRWETILVVLIIGAMIVSTNISPFFREQNFLDIIKPFAAIGLMTLGLSLVVIAGEIDISVTSMLALSAVIFATSWSNGVPLVLACVLALLTGAGLGLFNGVLVAVFNLPSLAVTLGTLAAYRGLAFVILTTEGVTDFPEGFVQIGFGNIGSTAIPAAVVVLLIAAIIFGVLLHATRFGRNLFTIGSNRVAAKFSGIPVRTVRLLAFVISGVMSAAAGLIYAGFFNTVRADVASENLLDVVTAVVLGGVNIFGGSGSVPGVIFSLVLIAIMRRGMGLANISSPVQSMVIGILLIVAIMAGNFIKEQMRRMRSRETT